MAKVTVYVTDDQLERLKAVRGMGRGGVSKAFQAFLESVAGGDAPAGRFDYARKLMPVSAAIERHRRKLARKVADGGPPADGGPVATALTLLLYRELLRRQPDLEATLEREFARFGLDELVATETEDVDLLAEPDPDENDVEIEEDDERPLGFGLNVLGEELRGVSEALRGTDLFREGFRVASRRGPAPPVPPAPPAPPAPPSPPAPRAPRGPRDHRSGRDPEAAVTADTDPRDVLTVKEFTRFTRSHDDWAEGAPLSPSQVETVRDLLRSRGEEDE